MILDILITALAVSYLSFGVVYKKGPFGIFPWLRSLGDQNTNPLHCLFCTSFWVGQVGAVYFYRSFGLPKAFILGVAFAWISSYLGLRLIDYAD